MKCKRVGGKPERFGYLAGGHSLRSGSDQQAKNIEAIVLRERSQRRHRI